MAIELGTAYVSVVPSTGTFKSELQKQLDGMGFESSFTKHGKKAGQGFGKSFGSELSSSMPGVGVIKNITAGYEGAASKAGAVAGRALGTAFKAAATAGVAALGYTLFKGFERYTALDSANQRLKNLNKTFTSLGKTGVDVQKVMKDVEASVTGTPYSLSDAFSQATNAIASGVTDIKQYMTNIADAAAFAGDDIANIGSAFTQVINQGKVDAGILQNQLRNLPIKAWLNEVYGAQVDVTKAISDGKIGIEQLEYVIQRFAQGTAQTAGDTIVGAIENMQTGFARLGANILAALFGGPIEDGANGLKEAVNSITQRLNDLNGWVVAHKDDIKAAFDQGADAVETLIDILGGVKDVLDDIGVGIGGVVVAFAAWKSIAGVAALTKALTGLNTMLATTLPASAAAGAAKMTAALGPVAALAAAAYALTDGDPMSKPGRIGEDFKEGNWGRVIFGDAWDWFGGGSKSSDEPFVGGGGQFDNNFYKDWYPRVDSQGPQPLGPPPDLQPGSGSGDKDKKAPKPVLPFNQALPDWTSGTPMTESFFSASSTWLDTRHDLEEKQAYLTQLEADNTATAAEIQDAKNDVLKKERDMHEQDMRLQDARVKAYEEFYKTGEKSKDQFTSLADSLSSVVKLDEDLGISRGLVGITENVLKFLAGLAAAPIMGMLAGAQKGMEAQLPDGWLGKSNPLMASGSGGMMSLLDSLASPSGMPSMLDSMMPSMQNRQPYGLPSGTNSGGYGGDASAFPDWVNQMGALFGIKPSTYPGHQSDNRNEPGYAPNPKGENRGIDWTGPTENLQKFADYLSSIPQAMEQVIWQNPNTGKKTGIGGGQINPGYYPQSTYDQHGGNDPNNIHVHTRQSQSIPMPGSGKSGGQYQFPLYPLQRAGGGNIPGSGSGDRVPVLAEPGEHMLSKSDVAAMGGQAGVYNFRNALHRQTGGPIPLLPNPDDIYSPENTNPALSDPAAPSTLPGTGTPAFDQPSQIAPPEIGPAAPDLAPKPNAPSQPAMLGSDGQPIIGPDGRPLGIDGNPMDMPTDQQAAEFDRRLAGFIPQAAKANTVPGTSNLSRIWMMGAEVANGLIDQAASAASTAASLAVAGGTMGVGAAGGSQAAAAGASFLIGLGTEAAKRGISYGAQMGGIFSDAIVEQLFPFGAPSFIGFDSANNGINGLIDSKKKQGQVYDSGGILEPGGVAVNLSQRPESVLTQQQWDAMAQTGPASQGYGIKIENVQVSDVDEMSRSLNKRQKLAAMQYTGRP